MSHQSALEEARKANALARDFQMRKVSEIIEKNVKIAELSYLIVKNFLRPFIIEHKEKIWFSNNLDLYDVNKTSKPNEGWHGLLYGSAEIVDKVKLFIKNLPADAQSKITIL